jgi:rRNA processing protein Gar1
VRASQGTVSLCSKENKREQKIVGTTAFKPTKELRRAHRERFKKSEKHEKELNK